MAVVALRIVNCSRSFLLASQRTIFDFQLCAWPWLLYSHANLKPYDFFFMSRKILNWFWLVHFSSPLRQTQTQLKSKMMLWSFWLILLRVPPFLMQPPFSFASHFSLARATRRCMWPTLIQVARQTTVDRSCGSEASIASSNRYMRNLTNLFLELGPVSRD